MHDIFINVTGNQHKNHIFSVVDTLHLWMKCIKRRIIQIHSGSIEIKSRAHELYQ